MLLFSWKFNKPNRLFCIVSHQVKEVYLSQIIKESYTNMKDYHHYYLGHRIIRDWKTLQYFYINIILMLDSFFYPTYQSVSVATANASELPNSDFRGKYNDSDLDLSMESPFSLCLMLKF